MENMVRLKAPEGASSLNHGLRTFEVKGGVVDVPDFVVGPATAHGYVVHQEQPKDEPEASSDDDAKDKGDEQSNSARSAKGRGGR